MNKITKSGDKLVYGDIQSKVYLLQDIPIDRESGRPKYNIMGARKYGEIEIMFRALEQIMFSPGPFIFSIRQKLKNFTEHDYLLLNGDPAIIGVTCAIASEMTNGKFKLLKWDRQEKTYYPIEINIHQK
jgi:hypothetical protein